MDKDRVVTNRPLAGTRRRGVDEAADAALERELLADEKEKAEHVMLVDLGRNDVGKVRTSQLCALCDHLFQILLARRKQGSGAACDFASEALAGTAHTAPTLNPTGLQQRQRGCGEAHGD